jgi:hypothetical protein
MPRFGTDRQASGNQFFGSITSEKTGSLHSHFVVDVGKDPPCTGSEKGKGMIPSQEPRSPILPLNPSRRESLGSVAVRSNASLWARPRRGRDDLIARLHADCLAGCVRP